MADALSDIDLNTFLERLKKNIGRSELTTMNESCNYNIRKKIMFAQIPSETSQSLMSLSLLIKV